MTEREFTLSAAELSRSDVWLAMGYKGAQPEEYIRSLVEEVISRLLPFARIRYMYEIVEAEKLSPKQVRLGGVLFTPGPIIGSYLKGMTHACVFVATAGEEFDAKVRELNAEGDIVADFVADSIGTVLAELAVDRLEKELGFAKGLSMPYSPGYCGWDIREQHLFFPLFPPQPCGITLSDSSLMSPEKSISGFFAMGENLVRQPYHCEICKNTKCYKRKNA